MDGPPKSALKVPDLDCEPGTEVEVWPAGDRTTAYAPTRLDALRQLRREGYQVVAKTEYRKLLVSTRSDRTPTREQIEQASGAAAFLFHTVAPGTNDARLKAYRDVRAVLNALHGQGDETDG